MKELVDAGEATPGEIVLLFAAGTDAERYEEALREEGLPTYRAAGRGYFGQQQVADLIAYLRLLQNRYDDEALVTVLASPFVGVSNDGLVLLRRSRRPPAALRRARARACRAGSPSGTRGSTRRSASATTGSSARPSALGLERLCEQIVVEHDYDLAVLAQWDGRRRYANLRKLGRLARAYESLRGPDIEGFVGFLRDQEAAGAREVEAAAEEEGGDSVRLLTVHAAKGLEFKVVVLADAGRIPPSPAADEILCLPDGRFGFRVVNPATGKREGAFGWDDVREAEQTADQAENRRLLYVAMTRAIDRLIVSGAIDPTSRRDANAPLHWILKRLEVDLDGDDPVELERGDARLLLRVDRPAPAGEAPDPDDRAAAPALRADRGGRRAAAGAGAPGAAAAARGAAVRRCAASPTARSRSTTSARTASTRSGSSACRRARWSCRPGRRSRGCSRPRSATPSTCSSRSRRPRRRCATACSSRYPGATEDNLERVESLLAAWRESELGRRLVGGRGHAARARVLVRARRRPGSRALRRVPPRGRARARRRLQDEPPRGARARPRSSSPSTGSSGSCTRWPRSATGAAEVEVVYTFLEAPGRAGVHAIHGRADLPELQAELSAAILAIREGDFRPTPSEWACAGCPALDVVCAGPRLQSVQ